MGGAFGRDTRINTHTHLRVSRSVRVTSLTVRHSLCPHASRSCQGEEEFHASSRVQSGSIRCFCLHDATLCGGGNMGGGRVCHRLGDSVPSRSLVGPVYRLLYRGTYTGHGVSQQIFVFAWVLHPSSGTVSSSFSGLPLIITSFVAISATTNVTRVLNNKTHSTTWAGASVWSIKQQNT